MIKEMQVRKFGDRNGVTVRVNLPEYLHEKLKDFSLEVIDLSSIDIPSLTLFVMDDKGNDVFQYTFEPITPDCYKTAFQQVDAWLSPPRV